MLNLKTISANFEALFPKDRNADMRWRAFGGERAVYELRAGLISKIESFSDLVVDARFSQRKGNAWKVASALTKDGAASNLESLYSKLFEDIKKAPLTQDPREAAQFPKAPVSAQAPYHDALANTSPAYALHRIYQYLRRIQAASLGCDIRQDWTNGAFSWDKRALCFAYRDNIHQFFEARCEICETLFISDERKPYLKKTLYKCTYSKILDLTDAFEEKLVQLKYLVERPCVEFEPNSGAEIYFAPYAVAQVLSFLLKQGQGLTKESPLHESLILLDDAEHPLHKGPRYRENGLPRLEKKEFTFFTDEMIDFPCLQARDGEERLQDYTMEMLPKEAFVCEYLQCMPRALVFSQGLMGLEKSAPPFVLKRSPLDLLKNARPISKAEKIQGFVVPALAIKFT